MAVQLQDSILPGQEIHEVLGMLAPQVIISGGGWRKVGAANPNTVIQDGEILEATEGIVIIRKNSSGILTYLKPKIPLNNLVYFNNRTLLFSNLLIYLNSLIKSKIPNFP